MSAPPTLGKAFNLATINAGGVSTLTITLFNPNPSVATLTQPFIDTLPSGVVGSPPPPTPAAPVLAPARGPRRPRAARR